VKTVLNFRQHFHKDGSFFITESYFLATFLFTIDKDLTDGEVQSRAQRTLRRDNISMPEISTRKRLLLRIHVARVQC